MEFNPNIIILILLGLSVFFLCISVFIFAYQVKKSKWKSFSQKLVYPAIFLIFSIFFLRFMVGSFDLPLSASDDIHIENISEYQDGQEPELNIFENLLNSFVRTFQTFSLDEEYTGAIIDGKKIFMDSSWGETGYWLSNIYGGLTALTNIFAPIIFTAFLLALLTSIFPIIRYNINLFRKNYYIFSELNERAIHLAEDIIKKAEIENKNKPWFKRSIKPLIIFTDAYSKEDDEKISELFQRAKILNAVCVKDDLQKLTFKYRKTLNYFLLDNESKENSNIHDLIALVTEKLINKNNVQKVKNECIIYLFSQNPEASRIVKKLYDELYPHNIEEKEKYIVIQIVQEYTSMVYNLFRQVPLYLPLLEKIDKTSLVITIIGGGKIGREAFLGAYWCGQMLDCKLIINVITEDAEKFKGSINNINPEILESGLIVENDTLKKGFNRKKYNIPYAEFSFNSVDAENSILNNIMYNDEYTIMDSDYFIVALGSDELNMTIASGIDRTVKRNRIKNTKQMPVIAYSIYHTETNKLMNKFELSDPGRTLYAFADLNSIYSYNNISMKDMVERAFGMNRSHSEICRAEFRNDEYNYWSSIARVYHLPYKIYSIGKITVKDCSDNETMINALKLYFDEMDKNSELCKKHIWLEQRRWNAYMRTKGFIAPTPEQWEHYAYKNGKKHKNLDLRLHPFIAESFINPGKTEIIEDKYINIWIDRNYQTNNDIDDLDKAMIKRYQNQKSDKIELSDDDINDIKENWYAKKYNAPAEDRKNYK